MFCGMTTHDEIPGRKQFAGTYFNLVTDDLRGRGQRQYPHRVPLQPAAPIHCPYSSQRSKSPRQRSRNCEEPLHQCTHRQRRERRLTAAPGPKPPMWPPCFDLLPRYRHRPNLSSAQPPQGTQRAGAETSVMRCARLRPSRSSFQTTRTSPVLSATSLQP